FVYIIYLKTLNIEFVLRLKYNIMVKLNKISAPSSKKIASLFLMGWLSANGVETGQGFRNCLNETQGGVGKGTNEIMYGLVFYDWLLKFPFASNAEINNGETITFCCDNHLA